MAHKLHDVPIERMAVEHYLFDLGQSVEKTAEIFGKDEEHIRKIYNDYMKLTMPTRRSK